MDSLAKGGASVALALGIGSVADGGDVDRWRGRQSCWHSPSRASTSFGCSNEHGKGIKARREGSGEASHGGGGIAVAMGYDEAAMHSIEPKCGSFSPIGVAGRPQNWSVGIISHGKVHTMARLVATAD